MNRRRYGEPLALATGFEVVVVKGKQLIQWQYVRSELFGFWQSPSILARALRNPQLAAGFEADG